MQLDVVDDEEPVVEVVRVGDGETLVLTVELRDFGRRRLAAIFTDKAHLNFAKCWTTWQCPAL